VDINNFVPLTECPVADEFVTLTDDVTDPPESSETHTDNTAPVITQQNDNASHDTDDDTDVCINDDCPSESVNNTPHVASISSDKFLSFTECVNVNTTVPEIPDGPMGHEARNRLPSVVQSNNTHSNCESITSRFHLLGVMHFSVVLIMDYQQTI